MKARGGTRGDRILLGRVTAGLELLGHSGVGQVELAYDDDLPAGPAPVLWWCQGNWNGIRVISEHFPYPAQAVEDLLGRVLNGGQCLRCQGTTIVGVEVPGLCSFLLHATNVDLDGTYRYVRSCQRKAAG